MSTVANIPNPQIYAKCTLSKKLKYAKQSQMSLQKLKIRKTIPIPGNLLSDIMIQRNYEIGDPSKDWNSCNWLLKEPAEGQKQAKPETKPIRHKPMIENKIEQILKILRKSFHIPSDSIKNVDNEKKQVKKEFY